MSDLKQSILTLFVFVVALLGIANVESFQESIINFSPAFFVLIALILFSELIVVGWLVKAGVRISQYFVIIFWLSIYGIVWYFYLAAEKPIEVNLIQLLLILLTTVLAFDVGRRIDQTDMTLEKFASSAYPNRARDIQSSDDIIEAEISRSRRYHHPLSILTIELGRGKQWGNIKDLQVIADEMLERFAVAKMGQILSDYARNTDVILRSRGGKFVILCPETNQDALTILANRIAVAVKKELGAEIECGGASFPDEALTFDDLLSVANVKSIPVEKVVP